MSFALKIEGNSPLVSSCLSKSLKGKTKADYKLLMLPLSLCPAGFRGSACQDPSVQSITSFVVSRDREQGIHFAGVIHSC